MGPDAEIDISKLLPDKCANTASPNVEIFIGLPVLSFSSKNVIKACIFCRLTEFIVNLNGGKIARKCFELPSINWHFKKIIQLAEVC